jgi:hypothetical protein
MFWPRASTTSSQRTPSLDALQVISALIERETKTPPSPPGDEDGVLDELRGSSQPAGSSHSVHLQCTSRDVIPFEPPRPAGGDDGRSLCPGPSASPISESLRQLRVSSASLSLSQSSPSTVAEPQQALEAMDLGLDEPTEGASVLPAARARLLTFHVL